MAVGDNQVTGDELVAEGGSEGDKQIIRMLEEFGCFLQMFINILLENLEIVAGEASVMGKADPRVPIFVEITVLVEGFRAHEQPDGSVDGDRVEQHAEGVGADIETVPTEIVAHVVGKTGSEKHDAVFVSDMERVLRGGYVGTELHILFIWELITWRISTGAFSSLRCQN